MRIAAALSCNTQCAPQQQCFRMPVALRRCPVLFSMRQPFCAHLRPPAHLSAPPVSLQRWGLPHRPACIKTGMRTFAGASPPNSHAC